eukprot:403356865
MGTHQKSMANFQKGNNKSLVFDKQSLESRSKTPLRNNISNSFKRPQTQFKQSRLRNQDDNYALFSHDQSKNQANIASNQAQMQKSGTNFIRKNFYMVKQQPGQLFSKQEQQTYNPKFGDSTIGSPLAQNFALLIRKQIYGQTSNNLNEQASFRVDGSDRLSSAYQRINKSGDKNQRAQNNSNLDDSQYMDANQKTLKRQAIIDQEKYEFKSLSLTHQDLKQELKKLEAREQQKEDCIIPNIPIIDASQSHNQPFIDLFREIKKEYTIENCLGKQDHQENKEIFVGTYHNDKAKGLGRMIDDFGNIFKGNFSDGVKKGQGIQLYMQPDKKFDVYRGEWNEDKPQGKGIYYHHHSHLIIEGSFKDGKPDHQQGNFKIRYENGDVYEGNMLAKKKSGKGKLYYINGDIYEGEWLLDKREGKGKFYIKSEDIQIDGQFVNDEVQSGKMIDKIGNVYITQEDNTDHNNHGRFVKGKLHGKVKIDFSNSNVFVGYFLDGKRSGMGKMIYNDLRMIQDEQEIELQRLQQEKQFKSQKSKKEVANRNSKNSSVLIVQSVMTEQGEYEGYWKRDKRHGFGVMKWLDGSTFEGEWKDDMRTKGKMFMQSDCSTYEGEFQNDQYHGKGSITMRANGRTSDGRENSKSTHWHFQSRESTIISQNSLQFERGHLLWRTQRI